MKRCILIIEDDLGYQNRVRRALEDSGYSVVATADGTEGLMLAKQHKPDLVILDLQLDTSHVDGWEVCRRLHALSEVPILITTGRFVSPEDVVRGLDLGADDYVCKQNVLRKPISLKELLARTRAILRRIEWQQAPVHIYRFGDVTIDFRRLEAKKGAISLKLRPIEFGIMRLLIEHESEPVSREQLLDEVWGYDRFPTTRTVDTHIHHLRRLLEDDPGNPRYILTVPRVGYKFIGSDSSGEG